MTARPHDCWEFDGLLSLGSPYLVRRLQTFFGIHFPDSVSGEKIVDHSDGREVVNDGNVVNDRTYNLRSRKVDTTPSTNWTNHSLEQNGHLPTDHGDSKITSTANFVIESKFYYYFFLFGAALGNELFYCFLWSTLLWHVDVHVTRTTCMVWCLTIYFGQVLKELVKWPRPSSPPVAHLETRYQLEYGMPSTHAVVGVTVPFTILYHTVHLLQFQSGTLLGWLTCSSWCLVTCVSRSYLGMHSVLDVLAGMLLGLVLLVPGLRTAQFLDDVFILHPYGSVLAVLGALTLCFLYPEMKPWNTARADSYMVCAVTLGVYLSCILHNALDSGTVNPHNAAGPRAKLINALLKTFLGGLSIALTRFVCKILATRLLCSAFHLDPNNPESLKQKRFEMPYKFLIYVPMCLVAIVLCPRLFTSLSID